MGASSVANWQIKLAFAACLAAWLISPADAAPDDAAIGTTSPRPNVVIFLSDDMGWGQLGYQGGKAVPTPNIDRIASQGVQLTQFYVQSVCSPTRAALLTGRYPFRNGMEERRPRARRGRHAPRRTHAGSSPGRRRLLHGDLRQVALGQLVQVSSAAGRAALPTSTAFTALIDSFTHRRDSIFDWHRNEQPLNEPGYSTDLIADEFARVVAAPTWPAPAFSMFPLTRCTGRMTAGRNRGKISRQPATGDAFVHGCRRRTDALRGREKRSARQHARDLPQRQRRAQERGPQWPVSRPQGRHVRRGRSRGLRACVGRGICPRAASSTKCCTSSISIPRWSSCAAARSSSPCRSTAATPGPRSPRATPSPHDEIVLSVPGLASSETGPPAIRVGNFKLVGDELYDLAHDVSETRDVAGEHPDIVAKLKGRLAQLASERRPPESHGRTPGNRPATAGRRREPRPDSRLDHRRCGGSRPVHEIEAKAAE